MGKKPVPQVLFDFPGMAKYEMPPYIPKKGNGQGNSQDDHALFKKDLDGGGLFSQEVNGVLDHKGDQELEKINQEQAREPNGNWPAVFDEVYFQGEEIRESPEKGYGVSLHVRRNTGYEQGMSILGPS